MSYAINSVNSNAIKAGYERLRANAQDVAELSIASNAPNKTNDYADTQTNNNRTPREVPTEQRVENNGDSTRLSELMIEQTVISYEIEAQGVVLKTEGETLGKIVDELS